MGYISSATIAGKSRADGTTPRDVTMQRVGNVVDGFILRETGANPDLCSKLTYRTTETKSSKGLTVRNLSMLWEWPYELPTAPGIVAGVVQWNKTGVHIPANCPAFVRADIITQLTYIAVSAAGTVGRMALYDPIVAGVPAF